MADAGAAGEDRGCRSRRCAEAEREVLWVLSGHCNSPIAGHATLSGHEMTLTAAVLDEAGGGFIEVSRTGAADRPASWPRRRSRSAGQGRRRDHREDPAGRALGRSIPLNDQFGNAVVGAAKPRQSSRLMFCITMTYAWTSELG